MQFIVFFRFRQNISDELFITFFKEKKPNILMYDKINKLN